MDEEKEKALNDFVDDSEQEQKNKSKGSKKVVMDEREGLIERVDKVYVTKDGKQLLREHY